MKSPIFTLLLLAALIAPMAGAQPQVDPAQPLPPIPAPQPVDYPGTIDLAVDATQIERRLLDVTQTMPVKPGPLVLLYPRFLPGTHGPWGDVAQMAGLTVHALDAAGRPAQRIGWLRDTVDASAFHISIPPGVSRIELRFQHLAPTAVADGRVTITPPMMNIQWNTTILYPAGHDSDRIRIRTRLKLPKGWQGGTALRPESEKDGWITYRPTSLETLVDSPMFAGMYTKRVMLSEGAQPVSLFMMADEPHMLEASEAQLNAHKNLVTQADKLFGHRPFRQYDFLLALSDTMTGIGLEHQESSENGVRSGYFKDWKLNAANQSLGGIGSRELLPHEYAHAWNGKYRRPFDLLTTNFNIPMRNSLLWVYEGQTQYWGRVLAARSGLTSHTQTLSLVAQTAAAAQARAGRIWRPLQDTTNEGTIRSHRNKLYANWQRTAGDYYEEATLIWLDADTLIRELSGGKKSLDDFARTFFGVLPERRPDGNIAPRAYDFADVVAALTAVQPLATPGGWAKFLRDRLDTHEAPALFDGLRRAGYRLVWSDTPSEVWKAIEAQQRLDDFQYSIGARIAADGKIQDVLWGSPALEAGLNGATTILAVNGLAYKAERLKAAITAAKDGKSPIELIVRDSEHFKTVRLAYTGGLRYPKLERIEGSVDRLLAILAPL